MRIKLNIPGDTVLVPEQQDVPLLVGSLPIGYARIVKIHGEWFAVVDTELSTKYLKRDGQTLILSLDLVHAPASAKATT